MNKNIFEPNPQNIGEVKAMNMSPLVKLVLEMGPLIAFFIANHKGQWLIDNIAIFRTFDKPIFPATAVFIVAILIALAISWKIAKKLPVMPLVSGVFVIVFGCLTLYLHNDTFIKIKPTIVNGLFGIILFVGLFFKRSLLGYVFDSAIELDDQGWRKLTIRWAWFFIFLAVVNEFIWRSFSDNFWASFKVFGVMPITIIFFLLQIPMIMKHSVQPQSDKH